MTVASSPRKRLRALLKTDEVWGKYVAIVRSSWPTEFDGFEQEIMDIQKARPIRLLGALGGRVSGKRLAEANMADASYRSRAVEITMMVTRVQSHLEMIRGMARKHIEANYSRELASWGLRGIRERDTVITSLFVKADEVLARYALIIELADWVINDVDAGGFSLNRSGKALEQATKREYGV